MSRITTFRLLVPRCSLSLSLSLYIYIYAMITPVVETIVLLPCCGGTRNKYYAGRGRAAMNCDTIMRGRSDSIGAYQNNNKTVHELSENF